jgi:hypothetical protein
VTYEIGSRVGAIKSADQAEVRFFGYGTYQGEEIPDEGVGGFGSIIREAGHKNPKILLDSGDTVWGCECWWGSEQKIKDSIGARKIVIVKPERVKWPR